MMNIIMGHYELHAQTTYNCILSREDSISTYQASSILFPASFFFFFGAGFFFFLIQTEGLRTGGCFTEQTVKPSR